MLFEIIVFRLCDPSMDFLVERILLRIANLGRCGEILMRLTLTSIALNSMRVNAFMPVTLNQQQGIYYHILEKLSPRSVHNKLFRRLPFVSPLV